MCLVSRCCHSSCSISCWFHLNNFKYSLYIKPLSMFSNVRSWLIAIYHVVINSMTWLKATAMYVVYTFETALWKETGIALEIMTSPKHSVYDLFCVLLSSCSLFCTFFSLFLCRVINKDFWQIDVSQLCTMFMFSQHKSLLFHIHFLHMCPANTLISIEMIMYSYDFSFKSRLLNSMT